MHLTPDGSAVNLSADKRPHATHVASTLLSVATVALLMLGGVAIAPHPITVIDGDTVDRWPYRYRLVGYDAPEIRRSRCPLERQRALDAKARLQDLIAGARRVELVRTQWRLDKWGRVLARLEIDGNDVSGIALAEDWGAAYSGRGPKRDWCLP